VGRLLNGSGFYHKYHIKGNDIGIGFVDATDSCGHVRWIVNQFDASTYPNTGANPWIRDKVNSHRIGVGIISLLDRRPTFGICKQHIYHISWVVELK
jgi:hypothetical protein